MTNYDLSSILESKKAYRKKLAQMPISKKLLLIEQMRESDLTITKSRSGLDKKLISSTDKLDKE